MLYYCKSSDKIRRWNLAGILLCLLLLSLNAAAQEYNYVHYTTEDGLAGETVYNITQDREGFIWFATETGLSRFDGKRFKNFTTEDGLPSNEVFYTYLDRQGRLWIACFKNEISYYYRGKVHNKESDPVLKGIQLKSYIRVISEIPSGPMIIIDNESNKYTVKLNDPASAHQIKDTFDPEELIYQFEIPTDLLKLPFCAENLFNSGNFYKTNNTRLFWLKFKGLQIADNKGKMLYTIIDPDLLYTKLLNDHVLWETKVTGGLILFDIDRHRELACFLPDNIVQSFLEDREGNYWFATKGNGVFKLGNPHITSYTFKQKKLPVAIQYLQKKDDRLYIGDDNGGFWAWGRNKRTSKFDSRLQKRVRGNVSWLKGTMEHHFIKCASSDFLDLVPGQQQSAIKSVEAYGDTLLVADAGRAFLRSISTGKEIRNIHTRRTTAAFNSGNDYYIGTLNGLYIYDHNGNYVSKPITGLISYFQPENDSVLWVGSYGSGIFRFCKQKLTAVINTGNTGISSNICRSLFLSGHYLWIGTDKGANKVDISVTPFKVTCKYSASDGLNSDIIDAIYTEGSSVYIGTQKGLNCFTEPSLPKHTFCSLKMTQITVSGINKDIDSPLVLKHKDNNIRFEFSGLSFLSGGKMTFRYRLVGLNTNWQNTTDPVLVYPSLPSGKYTLELYAVNKFGDMSPLLEKDFEVGYTLYEHWWFRLGTTLLVAMLLLVIVQLRLGRIRKKEQEKQQTNQKIIELEQMALRAQMNPHFIFNCLNSIQHYVIQQDIRGTNFYLAHFATLVRQTLDNASQMYISFEEEIAYINSYVELERLQQGVTFEYHTWIDPLIRDRGGLSLPNMVIQPYVENAIKHGLNQRKTEGLLSLSFKLVDNNTMLECIIEDNGPGIDLTRNQMLSKHAYRSKGMSITDERIKMLNKIAKEGRNINVCIEDLEKYQRQGTRVIIYFPVQKSVIQ